MEYLLLFLVITSANIVSDMILKHIANRKLQKELKRFQEGYKTVEEVTRILDDLEGELNNTSH